jgi:hypothetical protein
LDSVNDKKNFIKIDQNGAEWYSKILENWKEVWARVWKGTVRDAGINNIPRKY